MPTPNGANGAPKASNRPFHARKARIECGISDFGFRISDFGFGVPNLHPPPGAPSRRSAVAEGLVARGLTVLVTRNDSSTVDAPQSASNAIFHSLPSESRGGRSPTWLSEGGWAGGGGGKKGGRRRPPARMQPAGAPQARSVGGWRDRRALALGGQAFRERVAAGEVRGGGRARARARARRLAEWRYNE